jgi:hypothetical protein
VGNDGVNQWDLMGLTVTSKYCVKQRTFTLKDDQTGETVTLKMYSGHKPAKECNEPDKEGVGNKGPIPRGKWVILTRPGKYKNTGKPGYILDPIDKNPGDDKHNKTGRTAFRIHFETPALGAGCIIGDEAKKYDALVLLLSKTKKGPKGDFKNWPHSHRLGTLEVIADCGDKDDKTKSDDCCDPCDNPPRAIIVPESDAKLP